MVITEEERGDKMEWSNKREQQGRPRAQILAFFPLLSLSLTHYYVSSPTKLTKYHPSTMR
jgi:hypothetical protein